MTMQCSKCRFYRANEPLPADDEYGPRGNCHRRAPAPLPRLTWTFLQLLADIHWEMFNGEDTGFSEHHSYEPGGLSDLSESHPVVFADDWCGEFEREGEAA